MVTFAQARRTAVVAVIVAGSCVIGACTEQRKDLVDEDPAELSTCEERIEAVAQQLAAEDMDPPELGAPAAYRALWRQTVSEKEPLARLRVYGDFDDCGPTLDG